MTIPVLDYAPPARPKWLLRTLVIILIIAAGAATGAAIERWKGDIHLCFRAGPLCGTKHCRAASVQGAL